MAGVCSSLSWLLAFLEGFLGASRLMWGLLWWKRLCFLSALCTLGSHGAVSREGHGQIQVEYRGGEQGLGTLGESLGGREGGAGRER